MKPKRLHSIIRLHHDLNWSAIAREALRKRMHGRGLLKELTKAKGLTVRQAISIDRAVKDALSGRRRLARGEEEDEE